MAERGLSAAGRPDDGRRCPLRNVQRDSVDNLLFAIGKRNVICMKIMVLRRKFRAGNIHGGQIQNVRCLIHAGIHHPQKAGLCAGLFQPFREQEGADAEHDAV